MLQVLVAISQKFCCRNETLGYTKVIHKKKRKKRKKRVEKKWTLKCLKYLKQWVLRCPSEKEKKRNE